MSKPNVNNNINDFVKSSSSSFKDNTKIVNPATHLAIKNDGAINLVHMIKDKDKENYSGLINVLHNLGFETYLAGGAALNFVYTGIPEYTEDIDILAVGENPVILNMLQKLNAAEAHGVLMINNTPYQVKSEPMKKLYLGMKVEENIKLIPVPFIALDYVVESDGYSKHIADKKKSTVFDLSFMNHEKFKEYK